MKHERINYTMVGGFVLLMAAVLFYTIYAITGRSVTADHFYTLLDNVAGVNQGTSVTFNGYKVGQIIDIKPRVETGKTRFEVSMAIKKDWRIRADSVAMISSPGLLSDSQIYIQEGQSEKFLTPGDEIHGVASRDVVEVMKDLGEKFNNLSESTVVPVLDQLKNDIGVLGSSLSTQIPQLTENLNSLVAKLQKNLDVLDSFINEDNRDSVAQLLGEANSVVKNINNLSGSLDQLVSGNREQLQQSIEQINNAVLLLNQKLTTIAYHLEDSSRNINEFSRQIKENPGVIIRNKPPEDRAVQ